MCLVSIHVGCFCRQSKARQGKARHGTTNMPLAFLMNFPLSLFLHRSFDLFSSILVSHSQFSPSSFLSGSQIRLEPFLQHPLIISKKTTDSITLSLSCSLRFQDSIMYVNTQTPYVHSHLRDPYKKVPQKLFSNLSGKIRPRSSPATFLFLLHHRNQPNRSRFVPLFPRQ